MSHRRIGWFGGRFRNWVRSHGWWGLVLLMLVAVLIPFRASTSPESELPVLAESSGPSSGFKVTFGLERPVSWSQLVGRCA